jgi:hypothetical protein
VGLAETLEPMTTWAPARQRERLMSLRPEQADRANWWLGVIQYASFDATRPDGVSPEDRRGWAVLAAVALEAASDTGDLAEPEVVTRLANLSEVLSRHGRPAEFHPTLRPDDVARRCLALAAMSPEEAGSTEWTGNVDAMRKLRRVRNVVHHAVRLADEVEDEQLRQELVAWREVLPKLP